MLSERAHDLIDLIRLRLPYGSKLAYFTVKEKRDVRHVSQISMQHPEINGYVSRFACSSISIEDSLEKLLSRL